MGRRYIEKDTARFVRRDITLVDMELPDGTVLEKLEPRRLFPVTDLHRYITLLDENGVEQGVIRDVRVLASDQRQLIEGCLEEYYLVPKISRIVDCEERRDGLTLHAETDRGFASIEIRILLRGFNLEPGMRVLIRDINDNRYEIPDLRRLDKRSQQIIGRYV